MAVEHLGEFTMAGVSFKKAMLQVRSKFAFSTEQIQRVYNEQQGNFFILSTCNRTEIYSTTLSTETLLRILSTHSNLSMHSLQNIVVVKHGNNAVQHLFEVTAGIDSQILGDYEIVSQVKQAAALAKAANKLSGLTEKLVCAALESSKQIKSQTSISNGKTSVAYAVTNLLNELANTTTPMRICLMGMGKIGTLTLKNFKLYLPQHSITIINRSDIKAQALANELGVGYTPYAQRQQVLACTDVLVVATGADSYVITKQDIQHTPVKLIFDLAVPTNVHPDVIETGNIQLYNIDQLSVIANQAVEARKSQLPLAEKIIATHILKLKDWEMRRNKYIVKAIGSSQTNYLSKVA